VIIIFQGVCIHSRKDKVLIVDGDRRLATGQKFDNFPPDSNIEALEVGH
jgi:hypothetical protein